MAQDRRIKLACQECKETNYWSEKNKKLVERRIELSKFCSTCRKHTPHREQKK